MVSEQVSPQITPSSSPPPSPKTSTMSGESSNLATNLKDNLTIVTFPSTLKLTSTNYLGWKTQVEALLQGLDLYRFMDGTHLAPEPTTAPDGSKVPHTDYNNWFRQDRLLFGALVGSLSPPIIPLITNAANIQELSLAQEITPTNIHEPASVFFAHHQSNRKSWPPREDNNSTGLLPAPSATTGQRPFLGKCQWCHQKGHSLNNCYTFKKVNPTIFVPPYKKSSG
ncbi:hypothetical protein LXL04_024156 [Taraxacum kok-saghyz]